MPSLSHLNRIDGGVMPFAEPGVSPHYTPDRAVRITHYALTLSLFPVEQRFEGQARIRFETLTSFDGELKLDFAEATVHSVEDGEGTPLAFTHHDGVLAITVEAAGVIAIRWSGGTPSCGLYFTGPTAAEPDRQHMAWTQCQDEDGHFVFPCHDHPGIKHPWSIRLEGPEGYTLLSNGARVEEGASDGRVWATFEQNDPMPPYLFTAVAAQLSVVETTWRDRSVRYLVPKGSEEAIVRAFGKTPLMMEVYSERTGVDYPWPRYDQVVVHDFVFGGMENIACTTMADILLVDAKGVLEWDPDGLVSHELAHQWFGDLVTCQDWSQGWLNESWATFMEAVWWEADRDADDSTWYRFQTMREYLSEHDGRYRRSLVSYDFKEPIDVFDRHLYQKGSCVLWTLREVLGEEAFWKSTRNYLEDRRFDTAHTRDFQRALERTTGINLDRFFHQFVLSPSHPQLEIKLSQEPGLVVCSIKQTQTGDGVPEAYHFPLTIEIVTSEGEQRVKLPVAERERAWAIPIAGKIRTVRVDPGLNVLATHTWKGPGAWFEQLLHDPDPVVAVRAARALVTDGATSGVFAVRDAMARHRFWGVRAELASLVGGRRGESDRDALIDLLQTDTDPRVRRAAASALGGFHDAKTADALLGVLAEEVTTWQLHGAAMTSLGKTRDPRAVAAVQPFLDVDSWAETMRSRALAALAATRDEAVLPLLMERTTTGQRVRVRAAAARALGVLGKHVDAVRATIRERLECMLREPGFRPQVAAINALATVGDPEAIAALRQVHRSAPDGRTRRMAYEATVRIGRNAKGEGLETLRREIEGMRKENAELRERLDRLERVES